MVESRTVLLGFNRGVFQRAKSPKAFRGAGTRLWKIIKNFHMLLHSFTFVGLDSKLV